MSRLDGGASLAGVGHGGSRPGAGRKRRGTFAPKKGDLEFARGLISALMRDEGQPAALRARCALGVLLKGENRHRRSWGADASPGAESVATPADPAGDGPGA